ncbi:PREDICTED: uncharacterized protein LOC109230622 [Nicotiana attenuata]|uniref:DUF3741 domain-containing protein n=1 Tax=Nicotiana attenuata TaxID=49451 RepID=A0A1J6J2B2_NICAT|nr:PREDICTED: uncharacterized protein LOC109230622 [Nicotiana attenuata]OIT01401.1 hypothetical protein A4A49_35479 [Nicotiana attenuata]
MAENPKDATSAKCFSGIFQRLLCGGSLPTHPSDQYTKPNGVEFDHSSQKLPFKADENISSSNKVTANSPGIVARLMGLDSLPEEKNTFVGSFPRSRSVNSLDYLMQFNLTENFHHRRVRTSVSFREIPNFDQEFKSEFLVFCFNDEEEKKNFSIRKSNKVGNQEMKPKKDADSSRKNIQKKGKKKVDVAKTSLNMSIIGQKKEVCEKQNRIANKVKKQVKFEDYPRKISVESKVDKKKKKSKSKCVVSTKIQLNSRKSQTRVTNPELAITSKVEKQKEINKEADYYIKVLGEICRLTEEELNESYWDVATRAGGDFNFEDLCLHFGQEILELLLDQIVYELL